jgi:hypothetical protein
LGELAVGLARHLGFQALRWVSLRSLVQEL